MIDYNKIIVNALKDIAPTYYEMTLKQGTQLPCISYLQLGDNILAQTDITDVSRIIYQVKVWGNNLTDIQSISKQIDQAMRAIGFERSSTNELYDNQKRLIQRIFTYSAISLETIN